MERAFGLTLALALLSACGVQGDPQARTPVVAPSIGVGAGGVSPAVSVSDGVGRVAIGPGGLRLGAAGIPLSIGR
ncbi:hypothetical protein EU805_14120 [Salipiger sp. IMCC34102]|uniref:hypothetical protein n=1 Tax=Salipiger sp. IMCC34102 TaxID=2510647 RepID=UPI00101DF268|nr:hypothetical protein [Salipiger sp. IMCC34102]RYH01389.1 hypothetical protein EU805_14120 [Salipiger sp. IMCC34102]